MSFRCPTTRCSRMPDTLAAALFATAILAILGLGGRLRAVALEFPSRGRRALGGLLLWGVMITIYFRWWQDEQRFSPGRPERVPR